MDSVLLGTSDAARELRRNPRTARRLAASGRLAARRIGPVWVVDERDLAEFIAVSGRSDGVTRSGLQAQSPAGGV
jgi:hypothetical protein